MDEDGISLPHYYEQTFQPLQDIYLPLVNYISKNAQWFEMSNSKEIPLFELLYPIENQKIAPPSFSSKNPHYATELSANSLDFMSHLHFHKCSLLNMIANFSSSLLSMNEKETSPLISEKLTVPSNPQKNISMKWLKEKGYETLALKLEEKSGYPWEHIKEIRNPTHIEQLIVLFEICQERLAKEQFEHLSKVIMEFTLKLCILPSYVEHLQTQELSNQIKEILGQLIFVLDKNTEIAVAAFTSTTPERALKTIKETFQDSIENICILLQNTYKQHKETQLQSPDLAIKTMIPLQIGEALLTSTGSINVGIIEILSDIFLTQDQPQLNHQANLSYALKLLQRSPKLRAEIEQIHRPFYEKSPSTEVIQASLSLERNRLVTDNEARLSVLTALLSHLRQGEEGSCFATSLAIEILSSHLGVCLKDLRQIIEEGKLIRKVNGVSRDIPFINRINDENLQMSIQLDRSGSLVIEGQLGSKIWTAPGMVAACRAIAQDEPISLLSECLTQLFQNKNENSQTLDIQSLLKLICEEACHQNPSLSFASIYSKALFAFSSQTAQPLLKIWQNAIASMAEAEEGGKVKKNIMRVSLDSLQYVLGVQKTPPSPLLQRLFLNIQKLLFENIQLQYDPTIKSDKGEPNTEEGGFVLYSNHQRLDNVDLFNSFLVDIVNHSKTTLLSSNISVNEVKELGKVIHILLSWLQTPTCLGYILARYHDSNSLVVNQLSRGIVPSLQNLTHTPWMTKIGNDSKTVLKIYCEDSENISIERFISHGAEEALSNLIEMCKKMSEDEKMRFLNNPNKLKPLCIYGKHRLPLMVGNPSFVQAWNQEIPTQEWINTYVLAPGLEIANHLIGEEMKSCCLAELKMELVPLHMDENTFTLCSQIVNNLSTHQSIKTFRQSLANVLSIHLEKNLETHRVLMIIDSILCRTLPPIIKKKLEESAVHFADTNWCHGINDIHFCFAVNPGSGKLELWEVYADGTHLVALDQNYWLFNQTWEFITVPNELIPDDLQENSLEKTLKEK